MCRSSLILSVLCLAATATAQAQSPPPIVYPAGAYTVTTPGPTTITYTADSVTFSWGPSPVPPVPPPVPPPPPPPPPAPRPIPVLPGPVWALAIYDPAGALPPVLSSSTLAPTALLSDVSFQPFKSTDASIASWVPHLPKSGLPALLFIQKSAAGKGELAYAAALPGSEADILAIVNKVRGK